MIRILGISFCCILLMMMTTRNGLNIAIYEIAKPIIIEKYCINKDKPESQCNGKCHLASMMDAEDTPDEEPIELPAPEFKFQISFFLGHSKILLDCPYGNRLQYADISLLDSIDSFGDIFHPPRS